MTGIRTISSRMTFFFKYIFAPIWIFGFGAGTLALFMGEAQTASGGPPSLGDQLFFAAVWVVGTISIILIVRPLKRVRLDDEALLISNYRREIRVPLSQIAEIKQNVWLNTRPVTIIFRGETEFGRRVQFIPPSKMGRWKFWNEDPIVVELRERGKGGMVVAG